MHRCADDLFHVSGKANKPMLSRTPQQPSPQISKLERALVPSQVHHSLQFG